MLWMCAALAVAGPLALVPDAVLDPVSGEAVAGVVVVEDGLIAAIADEVPEGAEVVDLEGTTLVPGYIDAHTHLLSRMQERHHNSMGRLIDESTAYRAIWGVVKAEQYLDSGFTTVRDVGNAGDYGATFLKRAVDEGLVPGPDLQVTGRIIAPFGGQLYWGPEHPDLDHPEYLHADGVDAVRRAVRENIFYEAGVIKVVVDPNYRYSYTPAEMEALVDEAHRAGIPVAAHVQTTTGFDVAVEAGVDTLEHAYRFDDDVLKKARKAGIPVVPTPFSVEALRAMGRTDDQAAAIAERGVERVRALHEAGLTLVFGTDTMTEPREGWTDGTMALSYVDQFAAAGLTGVEVLRTMTSSAADAIGMADRGRIAVGQRADLVAVAGDPVADPKSLKDVVFVMRAGAVVRRP